MANVLKVLKGGGECTMAGVRIGLSVAVGILAGPYKKLQGESIGVKQTLEDAKIFWDDGVQDIKEGLHEKR